MKKADGAYSELLGGTARKFVESTPRLFIQYLSQEPLLTVENGDQWAWQVAAEIRIEEEGKEENAARRFRREVAAVVRIVHKVKKND